MEWKLTFKMYLKMTNIPSPNETKLLLCVRNMPLHPSPFQITNNNKKTDC